MNQAEYSRRLEAWEACQRIICCEPQQSDPETVANAYLAENANDDLEPADFEWLVTQCERNTSTTHEADGSVWWERGSVSFECGHVDHDHGEVELIAVEWRVDGQDLPKTLEPTTRGEFRRLCLLANRTPPEPQQPLINEMTPAELRQRLWAAVAERDRLRAELESTVSAYRKQLDDALGLVRYGVSECERMRAQLERIRQMTGVVHHRDDQVAECYGCGCISATAEECVAEMMARYRAELEQQKAATLATSKTTENDQ